MKYYQRVFAFFLFVLILSCSQNDTEEETRSRNVDRTANLQATGDSANDILSNTNFDNIHLEIAHVAGFRPTNATMEQFTNFIRQHTFKENITVSFLSLDSPEEENLTLQQIADLESENRTAYNDDRTLAIYIYFADAPSEGDEESEGLVTLGAVYRNTSMIIFGRTIRQLAARSFVISVTDIESATLNHEFGHLFGLVDLGSDPVNEHEDTEAPNHCNVEGCLMRAELQFDRSGKSTAASGLHSACNVSGKTILNLLASQTAKSNTVALDPECLLDLRANGGR